MFCYLIQPLSHPKQRNSNLFHLKTRSFHTWMAGQGLTQLSLSTLTHTDLALLAPQVKLCSLRDSSNCASISGRKEPEPGLSTQRCRAGRKGYGFSSKTGSGCMPALPQGHCHGERSPSLEQAFCRFSLRKTLSRSPWQLGLLSLFPRHTLGLSTTQSSTVGSTVSNWTLALRLKWKDAP